MQKSKQQLIDSLFIDFTTGRHQSRCKQHGKELIAKAVGIKGNFKPTLLDTTAGLARDAFTLAAGGCSLTLIERSPIVFSALKGAFMRAAKRENTKTIIQKIQLIQADSINYLAQSKTPFDVIYLDPMFPKRKKKAKVKKEMQILQTLLGDAKDEVQLFQAALKRAKKRVVIKRPRHAPYINDQKPDIQFKGKSCRFDVYLIFT